MLAPFSYWNRSIAGYLGFQSEWDHGTSGDWYVDASAGGGGDGSFASPFNTITAAVTAASGGDVIKVRAGTYRETVDLSGKSGTSGNPTTISGYAKEKPVITGATVLTGWTQCDASDAATVGANYANIYKLAVSTSSFVSSGGTSDPRSAFLHEDGEPLYPAVDWLPNPRYPLFVNATDQWKTATLTVTSGGLVTGFQLPAMTDNYTQAQIENADVVFHAQPNTNYRTKVASFNTGTKTINLTDTTRSYESNSHKDQFALVNILPAMEEGGWGFVDGGAGTTTLYIWPRDVANLTSGIEYSARGQGVLFGNGNFLKIEGLEIRQVASAGASNTDALYAISAGGVTKKNGQEIFNCLVTNTYRAGFSYAPIWIQNCDGWRAKNVTVSLAIGQFGVFYQGGSGGSSGMTDGGWMDRCVIELSENSPIRLYGQTNQVTSFCAGRDCGMAAHANKGNNYSKCHQVLWYGCDFRGCSGYQTWQQTSAISIVACNIPATYDGDGRAIHDQNTGDTEGTDTPAFDLTLDGSGYILNNLCTPYPGTTPSNGLTVTKSSAPEVTFSVHNNIVGGATVAYPTAIDAWSHNVFTSGSTYDASDTSTTAAAAYTNPTLGDFTFLSPIRSATAKSLTAEIADLRTRFPQFTEWHRDLAGNAIDWSAPPVGPYADYDAPKAMAPQWVDLPEITGTALDGEVLTVSTGFIEGYPFPTATRQWVRSLDGATWSAISGQTATTYTIATGDVGYYIGCETTMNGEMVRAEQATQVESSYPLADPVHVNATTQTNASTAAVRKLESTSFTSDGTPLLVVYSIRGSASSDTTATITAGTAGRSFGTGTSSTFVARVRRTNNQSLAYLILSPPTGTITVQGEAALSSLGTRMDVLKIGGLTATGAVGAAALGTTVTTVTPSVTTTVADGGVLFITNTFNGSNSVSSTATEISEGNTGGTTSGSDLVIQLAYSKAETVGAYSSTSTMSIAATTGAIAIELKS